MKYLFFIRKKILIISILSIIILSLISNFTYADDFENNLISDNTIWFPAADEQITMFFRSQAKSETIKYLHTKNKEDFIEKTEKDNFWSYNPNSEEWTNLVFTYLSEYPEEINIVIEVERGLLLDKETRTFCVTKDIESKEYTYNDAYADSFAEIGDFLRSLLPIPFRGSAKKSPANLMAYIDIQANDKIDMDPLVIDWLYSDVPQITGGMGFVLLPSGPLANFSSHHNDSKFSDEELKALHNYAALDWAVTAAQFLILAKTATTISTADAQTLNKPFQSAANSMQKILKNTRIGNIKSANVSINDLITKNANTWPKTMYVKSNISKINEGLVVDKFTGKTLNQIDELAGPLAVSKIRPEIVNSANILPVDYFHVSEIMTISKYFNSEYQVFINELNGIYDILNRFDAEGIVLTGENGATYKIGSQLDAENIVTRMRVVYAKSPYFGGLTSSSGKANSWGGKGGAENIIFNAADVKYYLNDYPKNASFRYIFRHEIMEHLISLLRGRTKLEVPSENKYISSPIEEAFIDYFVHKIMLKEAIQIGDTNYIESVNYKHGVGARIEAAENIINLSSKIENKPVSQIESEIIQDLLHPENISIPIETTIEGKMDNIGKAINEENLYLKINGNIYLETKNGFEINYYDRLNEWFIQINQSIK